MMDFMNKLKHLVVGTPLEGPARFLVRRLRGSNSPSPQGEWDLRALRDETNMERVLRRTLTRTSNCVDIGAHAGVFLRRFTELSPEGHHFAFEPLPELASSLMTSFPMVSVFACALGNATGRVSYCHVLNMPTWSG